MIPVANAPDRLSLVHRRFCDELCRRLLAAASTTSIGMAFQAPGLPEEWIVPFNSDNCKITRTVEFTQEPLSECRLRLCASSEDAAGLLALIEVVAQSVAEIQDVTSREDLLMQELGASWETLAALYESSLDLQSSDNLQGVIDRLLDRSVQAAGDSAAVLWIANEGMFEAMAERNCERLKPRTGAKGLMGAARLRGDPMVLDANSYELQSGEVEPELRGAGAVVLIPVRTRAGLELVLQVWRAAGSQPFESPAVRLLEAIALQAASTVEKDRFHHAALEGERMRQEMEVVASIQQRLLLGGPPTGLAGVDIANYMLPSLQVGGDFYQFVRHSATCFDAVVADVMGKGIGSALMGAATKGALHRVIAELKGCEGTSQLPQPSEIVSAANREMCGQLMELDSFVTLYYARLDLEKMILTYVDAGHSHAQHFIKSTGAVETISGDGIPLGFQADEAYTQRTVSLEAGDVVFLYSDGVSESASESGEFYGAEGVAEFLTRQSWRGAAEIASEINREVTEFRGSQELTDDFTCLVIKLSEAKSGLARRIELKGELDELERLREWVRSSLVECSSTALGELDIFNIQLALQEAATNVIFHGLMPGESRRIEVSLAFEDQTAVFQIAYEGEPFTPEDVPEPDFDGSRDHGFGVFLMKEIMDEVAFTRENGKNTIRMVKSLDSNKEQD